jgi:hypothetical protein
MMTASPASAGVSATACARSAGGAASLGPVNSAPARRNGSRQSADAISIVASLREKDNWCSLSFFSEGLTEIESCLLIVAKRDIQNDDIEVLAAECGYRLRLRRAGMDGQPMGAEQQFIIPARVIVVLNKKDAPHQGWIEGIHVRIDV